MLPPPLPPSLPRRRARSALALSLLWPGLGQLHNHQFLFGTLALVSNTVLYFAAIPWGRLAGVYALIQEQSDAIVDGRTDPSRAVSKVLAAATAPLPDSTALFLTVSLFVALALHAFLTWQAWNHAKHAAPSA